MTSTMTPHNIDLSSWDTLYRSDEQMKPAYTSLFIRWLLHVSARQRHHQGATRFLSELLHRQYGRRQVLGCMVEPLNRLVMQQPVMVNYPVYTAVCTWYCAITVCCITRWYIGYTIRLMTYLLPY
jgi:hypothetical protein